ncbi:hypothetical protein [Flavobacterium chilense]|uniref:Uncharacterized protein n=1 Tax=Flavobacterium chilense TaxID=946677 RepID=A0A1M6ZW51_9FLAO|nr:hypothetical protein [Flavobacterium chilense]SHL34731.1 hypothetical protein SAMN05444484_1011181 [Flavobacterium chilense]
MSLANQYNLNFHIWTFSDGITKKASIGVSLVNGSTKNHEIASFLEPNGIRLTQEIIDDINSLNLDPNLPFNNYVIWGGNQDESVEIKSAPFRAVFNKTGKPVEIPIADFLQILQEWKDFLQNIPNPHWLSNR